MQKVTFYSFDDLVRFVRHLEDYKESTINTYIRNILNVCRKHGAIVIEEDKTLRVTGRPRFLYELESLIETLETCRGELVATDKFLEEFVKALANIIQNSIEVKKPFNTGRLFRAEKLMKKSDDVRLIETGDICLRAIRSYKTGVVSHEITVCKNVLEIRSGFKKERFGFLTNKEATEWFKEHVASRVG